MSIRFYSDSLDVVSAENWNHKVEQKILKNNCELQIEDIVQDNKYRKQDKEEEVKRINGYHKIEINTLIYINQLPKRDSI